jgi:uncharacterized protein YkwD
VVYETIEGQSVWQEAKEFLINQKPLRPFEQHQGLSKAAQDHASDIMRSNSSGHQGSDGSTFIDRIQRYCKKGIGSMIELLGTTYIVEGKNSIELALLNLIIDDGVANRGHRKALFNKEYKYIGTSFIVNEEKIFSVITMSQANLEVLKFQPLAIATSTSHLKTLTEISEIKETSYARKAKENFINAPESDKPSNIEKSEIKPPSSDHVWTFKNVGSAISDQKAISKKSLASKHSIPPQSIQPEPSIFKEIENSPQSNISISNSEIANQKPVYDHL